MTITHKKQAAAAVFALISLLMLPNLALLVVSWNAARWHAAFIVAASVIPPILLLFFFALFGKRLWLGCLLLTPFAMLAPPEFFYVTKYGQVSSAEILGTVSATNPGETIGYFGWVLLPLALSMLAGLLLALGTAWLSYTTKLRWSGRIQEWAVISAIALPTMIFVVGLVRSKGNMYARLMGGWGSLAMLDNSITMGYPFGVIRRVWVYEEEWQAMYADFAKLDHFSFHARQTGEEIKQRQVYVLVIGESSRRDHWQLFGYDRPTNPELTRVQNLIPITDLLSSWPQSITAIPALLTRKPVTASDFGWKEASILRAMQESGYDTWWISNQLPIGRYDSPVGVYALEAKHQLFLNHADWTSGNNFDENLIQPLRDVIVNNPKESKIFIVLHMMGSHGPYDKRYPPAFMRFIPIMSNLSDKTQHLAAGQNSYDNTILYTDHVLAQIISVLRQSDVISALWFESDHGESLPNATCTLNEHGNGTRYEFMVPALFWYSDGYKSLYPQRVSQLQANADKQTLSASTFESLIDMTGVDFPGHDSSWSLFSSQWAYHPRIVHGLWATDFDKARFSKGCQMVFPPTAQ
jgi:glucan phosphoethanolaminetransferase (alkaline phosphatase superfamily)